MLFLLDKNIRTVKWNGIPLHETSSAIVKEETNGDFYLTVRYPITDSGIYQLIKEDMLIKAPTPVLGPQLFRIKKPVENDDSLDITAYHISDDIMRRSIKPISVVQLGCAMALSQMVQNAKTDLGDFSFTSDILDNRTFNTTETETLYSVLMDGKHSIVGTWEGELVRDNFALSIKRSRGSDRGVIITTHKNLKSYQRTKNSQNVVTRIHARSTFKPEGAEDEVTLKVTVDSPLINSYPYINEKEYENNNAKTIDELRKWAEAKFKNEGIDKVSDAIKIEAYELDGQVVHLGDTVNLKSRKHSADLYKKAIAYEFNSLTEEYISITFDDKPGVGGSGMSSGLSNAADAILGASATAQDVAIERALKNADAAFDAEFNKRAEAIKDDIEKIKAHAEANKAAMTEQLNMKINQSKSEVAGQLKSEFDRKLATAQNDLAGVRANLTQAQSRLSGDISQIQSDIAAIRGKQSQADNELAKQVQSINQAKSELAGVKTNLTQAQSQLTSNIAQIRSDVGNIRIKQGQQETEIGKQVAALNAAKTELAGVKSAQSTFEQSTTRRLAELTNLADGKASKSEVKQTADELASRIASVSVGGVNLFKGSRDFSGSWVNVGQWTRETEKYKGLTVMSRAGSWLGLSQPFEAKKGETYTFSFYIKSSAESDQVNVYFVHNSTSPQARVSLNVSSAVISDEWQRLSVIFKVEESGFILPRIERFNTDNRVYVAGLKLERGTIATDYSENPEDIDGRVSAVESNFKQRADSLEAGVSSLREGLSTKADSSTLNLLSDRILASVKSLETNMDNKLDSKLSTAVFEVRASGIRQEILNATKDKADKALVTAEAGKLREELASLSVGGRNLLKGSKGPFKPNGNPTNFDNQVLYRNETSIHLVQNEKYRISAKTDGIFDSRHNSSKESDNVVLWLMDKAVVNYQIVSDAKTGTTGTEFVWSRPTGIYHLRVNTYRKDPEKLKSVWEVKVEQGSFKTGWSPAPEDTEGQITEAKATFERTAQGLRMDLTAVQSYVNADNTRAEALRTYSREETVRQLTAERKAIEAGYVAKAQHTEDVRSISRRFEELKTSSETKLAEYKQGIDGQLANVQAAINTANGSLTSFNNWKQSAQETLNKVGKVETGLNETKTSLAEFKRTAEGQLTTISQQVAGKASQTEFKQRADSIEAGVSSLREGLKTKADSSALNLLSDSIKQSVKSLETDTQNKLDQKLSTAEFEVRASGIRQEILNATKDKADKTLVVTEAGKLREELASQVGSGRNLWINSKIAGNPVVEALPAGHITGQKQCYKLTNNQELSFNIEPDFSSRLFRKVTFSAWVKYENVVRGANNWNVFNCFKHYMFLRNSQTGTTSSVSYLTLAGYDGTSDWKRIVFTYDYSANKGYDQLKTLLKFNLEGVRSGTAWITGVQVEFGSVANEYTPATEDVEGLITEAKATFERTAQGLRVDLAAVQAYVNTDGTRSEALRTYSREETARQLTAERKLIEAGYVGKAQHAEDVRSISRRFEELKSSSDTKFAEFKQGIDGQFATMSSQIGETIKKSDISITPGQITLGTGKVVNGQTLASLFVQNPESMQAITKLMRITGDLIVDGSITGRDLAAGAITTPHLAAGAVTAEVLGANAVTADKVKADDALLEKLTAGEALLRKLMAKDAFINRLQSIDFTAEQIKGGLLRSIDGSLIFDLNKNTLTMSSNTAAIKRVLPGHPTQFMRYETERKGNVDYTRTIIGSNRNGSEKFDSVTFAGLVVENSNKAGIEDSLRLYGDNTYFRHAQGEVGWNINAVTQRMSPATWQKESAFWARSFVVPKHRTPNGRDWVKLEETVAALWRLWEHASGGQVTMTGAMRDKINELVRNYGYNYGIS